MYPQFNTDWNNNHLANKESIHHTKNRKFIPFSESDKSQRTVMQHASIAKYHLIINILERKNDRKIENNKLKLPTNQN